MGTRARGDEVFALLRIALRASSSTNPQDLVETFTDSRGEVPRDTRELVDGILFSRKFIIGYNVILSIFLALCAAWHWTRYIARRRIEKRRAWSIRRSRQQHSGDQTHSDTSSETICSTTSPQIVAAAALDERKPLLTKNRDEQPARSRFIRATSILRAWLMYQPADIPIVNKQLPSNSTTLVILIWLAFNLFFLFYGIAILPRTDYLIADRAGLLFAANLPVLYLFGAKNAPIRRLTGFSYENLNILHRRLGEWLAALAIMHAALMIVVWYHVLRPFGFSFFQLLALKLIWLGTVAFFCYEILYLTSLSSFRQAFYEVFLASHIILQLLGLIFLFLHHRGAQIYVAIAIVIFLTDRIIFRYIWNRHVAKADLTVLPDGETLLLSIAYPNTASSTTKRESARYTWYPTSHIFISLPVAAKAHIAQSHPFTIASRAPLPDDLNATLDLIIRARDGFTRDLLHLAQRQPRIDIAVDGPYGSRHALEMVQRADVAVLVAGGSGIAVCWPLVWERVMQDNAGDGDSKSGRRTVLVWVVHDERHVEWLGAEKLLEAKERGLEVVMPPPTSTAGRPDVAALVEAAVVPEGEMSRIGVVVSGPDGMNRGVRNKCAELVGRTMSVDVVVEKFGW